MIDLELAKQAVGPGWHGLLQEFFARKTADVTVSDVKEKYGSLRIYVFGADEELLDFIDALESRSGGICEVCGQPGHIRKLCGWLMCRCDSCWGQETPRLRKELG